MNPSKVSSMAREVLVVWLKLRKEYEEYTQGRGKEGKEDVSAVMKSVKSFFDASVLETLCEVCWGVDQSSELFREELHMNMSNTDIDARVIEYFHLSDKNEDEFDDADEPTIGGSVQHEEDVRDGILQLVKEVIADGFPWEFEKELTRIALRFDLWRTRLGADPPAKATPMRIRLKHGANPYRCKAKKYPPEVHRFMDDFNSKPVELGWYMTIVRGGGHAPHYQYVKVVGAFDRQQTTRQ
ncbi:hypothetical protein PC128_g20187 [Phytophthora cactorum]|nr:hypothetical protein PC128_g20187 [Phytophthora cactorum]